MMERLLKSAKFLTLILDVVISLILFFVGKYGSASLAEDIKFLIITIQPVFVALIASIAYEDASSKSAGMIYQK